MNSIYIAMEVGTTAFLIRGLFLAFRSQPTAVKGTLGSAIIFIALFVVGSLVVPSCNLWALDSWWASLYGDQLKACFSTPKQRFALSPVIAGMVAAIIVAVATALTNRSKPTGSKRPAL
jgi:hypothetical protein